MKKQRNYFKSKEQEKSPEKNNETDLNSLSDPGFKKQAIKMLKNLRKVIDKNVAHCNNELKTIKMSQSNNSIAEIKTNLAAPGAACVLVPCGPGTSFVKRQLRRLPRSPWRTKSPRKESRLRTTIILI